MGDLPNQYIDKVKEYEKEENQGNSNVVYTIDDALLEYIADFGTKELLRGESIRKMNLKMNWYQNYTKQNKPRWNVIYFHFKSLNTCVICVQTSHTLADGILLSKIVQNMYSKMFDQNKIADAIMDNCSDETKLRLQIIHKKKNKILMKVPRSLYWIYSMPSIIFDLFVNSNKSDPNYPTFSQTVANRTTFQFGPSIKLQQIRKISKLQKVCIFPFCFGIVLVLFLLRNFIKIRYCLLV